MANTNGMVGISIATDKDYELGKLKLIDAKAALVDIDSGLLLYREPKPQGGYRVYGGDYAALDAVQTNSALEVEIQALQDDITRLQTLYDGDDPPNVELQNAQAWQTTLKNRLQTLGMASTGLSRVQATTTAETAVMAVDGVQRLVTSPWVSPWLVPARAVTNGAPIAAFSTPACADDYWSLYVRQPAMFTTQFDAILMKRNWTSSYPDPDTNQDTFFPEWAASNTNPIQAVSSAFNMLVPWVDPRTPIENPPTLDAVGRGGFFVLGLPYVTMSNVDRYNEETAALLSLNSTYQSIIAATTDPSVIAQYTTYIAENNARINYIATVPLWGDLPITPRNILGLQFRRLDRSKGQVAPYISEDMTVNLSNAKVGDTIPVGSGSPTLKRGCVINAGPWAFVAVTVKLQADDITDGVDVYKNPEARINGLGIPVKRWAWPIGQENAFNVVGGSFYEAGYKCSSISEIIGLAGAWGSWGYSIEGDAQLISIDDLPQGQRELYVAMLAPSGAQSILLEDINGDTGSSTDEVYQKTHYFLTQAPLNNITVKFWLRNHATDVFRWGWMTESHSYPRVAGQLCPTIDPGYNTGVENISEAKGCGGTLSDLGGGKLFPADPTYPQLGHDVLLGTAIFTCVPNPYTALGLAYGTIWKCNIDFNFNNNLRALDVPLLPSDVETPGTT